MTSFENLEGFALSKDRSSFLERLVKGSDDYYYYTLLHLLNRNADGKLTAEIFHTIDQYEKSGVADYTRLQNLKTRANLLSFDNGSAEQKKQVLEWIVTELGLHFSGSPELVNTVATTEEEVARFPSVLDPAEVSAFSKPRYLNEYKASAYPHLLQKKESLRDREKLLNSLATADSDLEGVLALVKADFDDEKTNRSFGQLGIHQSLSLEQADELLKHKPGLIDSTSFISFYIGKLAPHAGIDVDTDLAAREEYLNSLWRFVVGLSGGFNSYKVTVLYHILALERGRGNYDEELFMKYLGIPRSASYTNYAWVNSQQYHASYGQTVGLLNGIYDDEELVRSYLTHFYENKDRVDIKPFSHYIDESYLNRLLAKTKLITGAENSEKWVALLGGPSQAESLKQEVDIQFSPSNPKHVKDVEAEVKLEVDIKNVSTLIVKVFEIDTTAYYRIRRSVIPDDISLDGLVAKSEAIYNYSEVPILKVRRTFTFPDLNKRGVFVIEFIGNGQSSRAIVHKGQLNYIETVGVQGHTFKILDEKNQVLNDAELWLDGHLYQPDKSGSILIPFTNSPSQQFILLTHNGFSSFHYFQHKSENYELSAGFYVDREALLKLERATVAVRSSLFVSGVPVSVDRLEEVSLELTATDMDGTPTTKKADNFVLRDGEESVFEFLVPENVRSFNFQLSAKVRPFSAAPGTEAISLGHSHTFSLNNIDSSPLLEDLHLSFSKSKGYRVHVFGKTGEPKANRMVPLSFNNKYLQSPIQVTLQSNREGIIELGDLTEIVSVTSVGVAGKLAQKTWNLKEDSNTQPSTIHARAGSPVRVAYSGRQLTREQVSFTQRDRNGNILHDRFGDVALKGGYLLLGGDQGVHLPVGRYVLRFRETGKSVNVRVVEGPVIEFGTAGHVIAANEVVEISNESPLQIADIVEADEKGDVYKVKIIGGKEGAVRVHVLCTSLHPEYDVFSCLSPNRSQELKTTGLPSAVKAIKLLENKAISEEYRYILDRKYAPKRAGNMLTQPSLLLQPRLAVTPQRARGSLSMYDAPMEESARCMRSSNKMKEKRMEERECRMPSLAACHSDIMYDRADAGARTQIRSYQPNIDFLPAPSTAIYNVRPDQDGHVILSRQKHRLFGTQLRIVATDGTSMAFRTTALAVLPDASPILGHKDLRLGKQAFDPSRHFTEQRKITLLQAGDKFGIADLSTAKFEVYDTLSKVYNLLLTLSGNNSVVQKFNFLLKWEKLSVEEKLQNYAKFASHELNFFVYQKDKNFFEQVVVPYLRNKKEKTFLDHFFLGSDLSGFLAPYRFDSLNAFEKILLGTKTNRSGDIAKFMSGQFGELPKNQERFNHIFNTALAARGLDSGDEIAISTSSKTLGGFGGGGGYMPQRQFFQVLGATKQWGETNYYLLQKEEQDASLIMVNGFWSDFAQHVHEGKGKAFVTNHVGEATSNYTEILLALAVLDLPASYAAHDAHYGEGKLDMQAKSAAIVFHKEVMESAVSNASGGVLVSQHYWDPSDATYINEEGEEVDKYITTEFLPSKEYGCQVILTNVSKSRAKVDLLMQIPVGSIPLNNGFFTQGKFMELPPNSTRVLQYYFYFPQLADSPLPHFPVQVSKNETIVAFAPATTLNVVNKLSGVDTQSWAYISQQAPEEDFLRYLATQNIFSSKVNLDQIKWRLQDEKLFKKVVTVLKERLVYHHGVWSFALLHKDAETVRDYLRHESSIVEKCRPFFRSGLLDVEWEESYEHLEYSPLVNERAHRKKHGGADIDNPQLKQQYQAFLEVLAFKHSLDSLDMLALTYYLLLQDRVDEALVVFAEIPAPGGKENKGKEKEARDLSVPQTVIQYDYLKAYLDFFSEKPSIAADIALKYADYPVPSWNKRFKEILQQMEEMTGGEVQVHDIESRSQVLSQLAATEASFDFTIEGKFIHITYSNLSEVTISFFEMDVEVLFSSSPFGLGQLDQFSFVRANRTLKVEMPKDARRHSVELPQEQQTGNSMVRVSGGALHKSVPHFAHSLSVLIMDAYGQLSVTHAVSGQPISRAYVKVYSRDHGHSVRFYKDGYTDLRGRFDYVSLNSDALQSVERFSILILTDTDGAVIREAAPPKI